MTMVEHKWWALPVPHAIEVLDRIPKERDDDPEFDAVVKSAFERLATSRELEQTYNKWFILPLPTGERLGIAMSPQLRDLFEILGLP